MSTIHAMANKARFDRMQKLRNSTMRIILKCNNRKLVDSTLEEDANFRILIAIVAFKIKHKMMPWYIPNG